MNAIESNLSLTVCLLYLLACAVFAVSLIIISQEDFLEASPVWSPCGGIDGSSDEWAQLTQLSLLANRMPAE